MDKYILAGPTAWSAYERIRLGRLRCHAFVGFLCLIQKKRMRVLH